MHETRNTVVVVLTCLTLLWALGAWLVMPDHWSTVPGGVPFHKFAALGALVLLGAGTLYVVMIRDRMDDELGRVTMGRALERDGLCFWPMMRVVPGRDGPQAEVSLYYQSRFAGPCEVVIHMRPEDAAFATHRGATDVHFAFRVAPGAFGVIHQPVGVRAEHQGEAVAVQIAAAVRWPHGKQDQLRSKEGEPVGTFDVDWSLAYRRTRHELCGEIEMHEPATVRLTLPEGVARGVERADVFNETIRSAEAAPRPV